MKKLFTIILIIVSMLSESCGQKQKLNEQDILDSLDHSSGMDHSNFFINLGDTYSYLIDSRLNIYADDENNWAIAAERLGYNPRVPAIELRIYYYGNCLTNLEKDKRGSCNFYVIHPIQQEDFLATLDEHGLLEKNASHWKLRGREISLIHDQQVYIDNGIDIHGGLRVEQAARLAILKHAALFRATEDELYKSIPKNMRKILELNEWYHKDFSILTMTPDYKDETELRRIYEFNKQFGSSQGTFEEFKDIVKKQYMEQQEDVKKMWNRNRPGSYETWQLIAKVIATKNNTWYKPTLKPNSHWKNWPDSGSM